MNELDHILITLTYLSLSKNNSLYQATVILFHFYQKLQKPQEESQIKYIYEKILKITFLDFKKFSHDLGRIMPGL